LDIEKLKEAMRGQDVVYANLAGDLERMAKTIVEAMDATGVKRLIFISSMGIYGEVPGENYRSVLDPYRKSAEIIEASNLDFTILRPAWFTHKEEVARIGSSPQLRCEQTRCQFNVMRRIYCEVSNSRENRDSGLELMFWYDVFWRKRR
jgi:uncharacterized protein YbjT (DUF2867 family)